MRDPRFNLLKGILSMFAIYAVVGATVRIYATTAAYNRLIAEIRNREDAYERFAESHFKSSELPERVAAQVARGAAMDFKYLRRTNVDVRPRPVIELEHFHSDDSDGMLSFFDNKKPYEVVTLKFDEGYEQLSMNTKEDRDAAIPEGNK